MKAKIDMNDDCLSSRASEHESVENGVDSLRSVEACERRFVLETVTRADRHLSVTRPAFQAISSIFCRHLHVLEVRSKRFDSCSIAQSRAVDLASTMPLRSTDCSTRKTSHSKPS